VTADNEDIKAKMREALEKKKGVNHPDDRAQAHEKAHGPEVSGGAAPQMHRRKAGGGGA
jgi:hypothetical protein